MRTITGKAAGVPFTALPPPGREPAPGQEPAPLVVTWHMLDAPRTDTAFAAALPMAEVPAWRVHLGMPMSGARMVDGRPDAAIALAREDALLSFLAPFVRQAAEEFPAALAALRDQLPVGDAPVNVLGASLGGAVALHVLTTLSGSEVPIHSAALVNSAIRLRNVVPLVEGLAGHPYAWTARAHAVADEFDLVNRAATSFPSATPLLVVSGEQDYQPLRTDAADLVDAVRGRARNPDQVELATVPGLAHPLAEEPGLEPAPQLPATKAVDEILTAWFRRRLGQDG